MVNEIRFLPSAWKPRKNSTVCLFFVLVVGTFVSFSFLLWGSLSPGIISSLDFKFSCWGDVFHNKRIKDARAVVLCECD